MEKVTIYHNPSCGTSRNVLAMIKHVGLEVDIIEYLNTPPSEDRLRQFLLDMGITARELLRTNVPEFEWFAMDDLSKSENDIIAAMFKAPILINRPIVVTSKGTRLCRPSEALLEILPVDLPSPYIKEDGEVIYPI